MRPVKIRVVQKIILLVMTALMLFVWPLCGVRRETEQRSGDSAHELTEEIKPGSSLTQTFRASESVLKGLDFALTFQESLPREGSLLFRLSDEKGRLVHQEKIPYEQLGNYTYFTVKVNKRIRKNALYQYELLNEDIESNLPRAVYTVEQQMHAAPNCGFFLDGVQADGEALTRYHWMAPLNYKNVFSIWAFLGITGFTLFEAAGDGRKKQEEKQHEMG